MSATRRITCPVCKREHTLQLDTLETLSICPACGAKLPEAGRSPPESSGPSIDNEAVEQTWNVQCPACDCVNVVQHSDLGVNLVCATCGRGFIYDEPLREQRRKERAAAKQRRREEKTQLRVQRAGQRAKQKAEAEKWRHDERRRHDNDATYTHEQDGVTAGRGRSHFKSEGNMQGTGCIRCGSCDLQQKRRQSANGITIFVAGVILFCCGYVFAHVDGYQLHAAATFGAGLLACVFGAGNGEFVTICGRCGYTWRA